ncbi:MAG: biotin transporter BioY [Methanomassiliicoccales archaeon]
MPSLWAFERRRNLYANHLFEWREKAGFVELLVVSLFFVALMGLAAQLRIYLPFTPVPFTGQVLVVLVAGFILGRFGVVSTGTYLVLGSIMGWFSAGSGISALTGLTAGYLFGFLAATIIIGEFAQRRREWSFMQILGLMILGEAIILIMGSWWLSALLGINLIKAVYIGILPFLAVDALKVIIASSIVYGITPRPT